MCKKGTKKRRKSNWKKGKSLVVTCKWKEVVGKEGQVLKGKGTRNEDVHYLVYLGF